ncbi:hypothetical protein R5R35_001352 [Gryllus longicercus]|uniref:NEDD8-activating enzyme E1 regulatory subunit n=1 Tax=Gryllus longicercus TaxID=2509291 RepID=A0AAN9VQU2_9ORTH|nr:Nedd8-activating enzyme E1 regulatory subunit [Gryllus bimaculatus]
MSSPAPKSPEQSEKNKKYDRQLRLWGDHGQAALESAHVCLINANGLGTEILKSLILPGIGAFTIVDGEKVTEEDIGCNFFLDHDSVGKSRAQATIQLLLELNPDVRGDYVDESVEQVLENNPDFFNNFSVVISTQISERVIIRLSKKLWELEIPFIACQSYGFIGYARIQVQEHTVIETHPDNEVPDLRLDKPFPSLKELIDSIDISKMELKDHAHVPYVVILYKCLQQWQQENEGQIPKTYREKESLRKLIRAEILNNDDGIPHDEENFEEAIKAVNTLAPTNIPSHVREILDDESCINLTSKSKPFWIMAKALREFVENEGAGALPLRGTLPDMTADTERYIHLQQVYHSQAAKDAEVMFRRVQQLLREINQSPDSITEKDVKLFCKHTSTMHLVRGSCIADDYDNKIFAQKLAPHLEDPESALVYAVLLRGVDRFRIAHGTYPGEYDDQVEPDIVKLKSCVSKLLNEWSCGPLAKDDYVHEICRYGGGELHSISAFVGGCIAQETIKFITSQYKPIHNTFIYDGITSNTASFTL